MLPTVGTEFPSLDEAKLAVFERCGNARYRMGTTQSVPGKYVHLYCTIRVDYSDLCSCRCVIKLVEGTEPAVFRVTQSVDQHTCSRETRQEWRAKAGDVMRKAIQRVKRTMEGKKQNYDKTANEAGGSSVGTVPSNSGSEIESPRDTKRRRISVKAQTVFDEDDDQSEHDATFREHSTDEEDDTEVLYPKATDVVNAVSNLLAQGSRVTLPPPTASFDSPTPIFVRSYAFAKQNSFVVYRRSRASLMSSFILACSKGHDRFRDSVSGMCPYQIKGSKSKEDGKWRLVSFGPSHNHLLAPSVPGAALATTSQPQTASYDSQVPPPSRLQPQQETFRIPSQPIQRPSVPSYPPSTSQQTKPFELDLLSFLRSVQPDNPHNPALAQLLVRSGIESFDVLCSLLAMEDSTVRLFEGELARAENGEGQEFGLREIVERMRSEL